MINLPLRSAFLFLCGLALSLTAMAHDSPYNGLRHWEIPSRDPDRINLTFYGPPESSRAVTWRTSVEVKKAYAQIAKAGNNSDFTDRSKRFDAETEVFDLGLYKSNKSLKVNYHSVVFNGLTPETDYLYRVGDGNERWSEWIQFKTASAQPKPFTFVYFGPKRGPCSLVASHPESLRDRSPCLICCACRRSY